MQHLFTALQARGVLHCASPGAGAALGAALAAPRPTGSPPVSAYAGFDPTGPSLHLGHLAVVMALRRLQDAGVRPIALVGGATALVGDPSGKSAERPLLAAEEVAANAAGIRRCLEGLLDFSPATGGGGGGGGGGGALLVDNADFYAGLGALDFLRAVGSRFRLAAMLNKDTVRSRLDAAADAAGGGGMSYSEFSYPLLQAYDFAQLARVHGCALQLGGADQWGNITAGIDYVRRAGGGDVHGATVPLLTTADGAKFGKSAGNVPVWLDGALTSHHAFYQYLLNTADGDAPRLLRQLTLLPPEELDALAAAHAAAPHTKTAQRALADAVTLAVRGPAALAAARRSAATLFGGGGGDGGGGPPALCADALLALVAAGQLPSAQCTRAELLPGAGGGCGSGGGGGGLSVADAAVRCGAAGSKAEARRLVAAGGLYLNHVRLRDPRALVREADFVGGRIALLSAGKKKSWALTLATA